jgi:hypothetical protein
MKKALLTLLTTVVLVAMLALPAQAAQSTPVEGLWRYISTTLDIKYANGNTFVTTHEDGIWAGGFSGTSTEAGLVVIHNSGFWSFNAIVSFVGTVEGKTGTLEMSVVGKKPAGPGAQWEGKWVILSGTGELRNLHGQGTWWGPGASGPGVWGDIPYAGQIHFAP